MILIPNILINAIELFVNQGKEFIKLTAKRAQMRFWEQR